MAKPLAHMRKLCRGYNCPLYIAGDIFDRWDNRSELVNFAIGCFSEFHKGVFAIPGQHDLPYHNYDDITKSSYWTLCKAGAVRNILPGVHQNLTKGLVVAGVPWGAPIPKMPGKWDALVTLAIIHRYIFAEGYGYPGAEEKNRVPGYKEELTGYQVAAFGDNHKGFMARVSGCRVVNCGGLMRRKSDEEDYEPFCAVIMEGGGVKVEHIPNDGEIFNAVESQPDAELLDSKALETFIADLRVMQARGFDFRDEVHRYVKDNDMGNRARELLLAALD